jgi:hypothetical protein
VTGNQVAGSACVRATLIDGTESPPLASALGAGQGNNDTTDVVRITHNMLARFLEMPAEDEDGT